MASSTNGEDALRILVVSVQEQAWKKVSDALSSTPSRPRLFWVSRPGLALAGIGESSPHVVLIDNDLGGADQLALIREVVADPTVCPAVVAMVEREAMDQARAAVLAGARGFVVKPLRADDLQATLEQVLAVRVAPVRREAK
ncbi:MAG TPA: response regulator, partial [Anaerolineae bacterium]|nr:response regulator [Anaerolineae bacterium]